MSETIIRQKMTNNEKYTVSRNKNLYLKIKLLKNRQKSIYSACINEVENKKSKYITIKENQEGNKFMKKLLTTISTKIVEKNLKKEANSACLFMGYQPKMPEAVKKMRKENK